jgi:molybdopterin-guanine dinucleotide biosynthesis protein A
MHQEDERSAATTAGGVLPPGVIVAGGLSRRMGREKALLPLAGRPLIRHVIDRFGPQVASLAINANGEPGRFAGFDLPVIPDHDREAAGPLAGIEAALGRAQALGADHIAVVPADAPFLPADLVGRLSAALATGDLAAVAQGPRGPEPLFGIWRVEALEPLRECLRLERRAVRDLLGVIPHGVASFEARGVLDPFTNLNTPQELAEAERILASGEVTHG